MNFNPSVFLFSSQIISYHDTFSVVSVYLPKKNMKNYKKLLKNKLKFKNVNKRMLKVALVIIGKHAVLIYLKIFFCVCSEFIT